MNTDPPPDPTPPPDQPIVPNESPPLLPPDVSKSPPNEWVRQLRVLRTIAITLLAANAGFLGVCSYAGTKVGTFEAAAAAGVLGAVISAAVVLFVLWPRKNVK